jgi:hypothetical protein
VRQGPILAVLDREDVPVAAALARVAAARAAIIRRSRLWSLVRSRSRTTHSRTESVRLSRTTSAVLDAAVTGAGSSIPMIFATAAVPTAEGTLRVHHRGFRSHLVRIGAPVPTYDGPPELPNGPLDAVEAMLGHAERCLTAAARRLDFVPAISELIHEMAPGSCFSHSTAVMPTPWEAGRLRSQCSGDAPMPDSMPMAVAVSINMHEAFNVLEIRTDVLEIAPPGDDPIVRLRGIAALERLRPEFGA